MTFFNDADLDDPAADGSAEAGRRTWLGWLLIGVSLALVTALAFAPSPYVVETPGPVIDTLGTTGEDGAPLIDIPTEQTYETDGTLDLLTVSVLGSPNRPASLFEVAVSWFDPSRAVVPREAIYPEGITTEQQRERSRVQMTNSQREAIAAALRDLGYEVPATVSVVDLLEDSPADGVLQAGDEIVSVDGRAVDGLADLRDKIAEHGVEGPALIGVLRDGEERTVEVTPTEAGGTPVIGVTTAVSYAFPFEVEIALENVGGPSAGLMFALGIHDKLTPGALTGGISVAGTGTIDANGRVGAIGGIRQKLYGAQRAGATLFLAPEGNCNEVVGNVPDGLDVVAVSTLDDALAAIDAVAAGEDPSSLPTCAAA